MLPLAGARSTGLDSRIRGRSLDLAGRTIYVAAEDAGLLTIRDTTGGPQVHPVSVGNNFFSPVVLTANVGDAVSWTNTAGHHNVESCVPGLVGCNEQLSNESFTSGPPADPIWIYSYTFLEAGLNPYICFSHPIQMPGLISVGTPLNPPPVPDGLTGTPMTVGRADPTDSHLSIFWDTASCVGALNHQILFGSGSTLPGAPGGSYGLSGAECTIGVSPPFDWDSPDLAPLMWWILTATAFGPREGSWGSDSQGTERSGPGFGGASGECGVTIKDLSNTCAP